MRREKVFLLSLFLLTLFLRTYKLGGNPYNFRKEEVFAGFNADSILKTGKDINGKTLPLVFQYFEQEKERYLPFYIYLTAPAVALFGLNEFAVRLPSAFFATLTVLLTYFLTKELFKKTNNQLPITNYLPIITSLLLALSPWHLHFSRQASPATLSLFFSVSGVYLFLKEKRSLAALTFALSLLSYQGHWLFIILLSLVLWFWQRKKGRENSYLWPFWCFLAMVLMLVLFKISAKSGELVFTSVFFDEYLSSLSFSEKILKVLENYFAHLSFKFLFFSGDTYINHGVGEMGELFLTSLPLVLVGLYQLFEQKSREKNLIFSWCLISFLQPSFSRFSPDSEKSLVAVVPLMIFTAIGAVSVLKFVLRIKRKILLLVTCFLLLVACFYDLLTYFHIYWVHYFKRTQSEPVAAFKPLLRFVKEKKDDYQEIFITNDIDGASLFTLFYLKYEPEQFLKQKGNRKAFDKFYFDPYPQREGEKKTLVVTSSIAGRPIGFEQFKEIRVLDNSLIFVLWES